MQNLARIGGRVVEKSLTKQKKKNNKCVRTDTNPPFAFDIAFSRAQFSRGFYRGYRDGENGTYAACVAQFLAVAEI